MKPHRPAWITLAAVLCLLALTVWMFFATGPLAATAPLALTLAFVYDLTHHAKSRQVKILSRTIVCVALGVVLAAGIWLLTLPAPF